MDTTGGRLMVNSEPVEPIDDDDEGEPLITPLRGYDLYLLRVCRAAVQADLLEKSAEVRKALDL